MLRKNKAILIRTEDAVIQSFKKSISENKVSTYGEGLKCLVTIAGTEVFQEYQECPHFSEYPPDSKHFIQCSRGKSGKRVPRKREQCQACAHNRVTEVLMKSRGKIEQENSDLQRKLSERQHKLGDLNSDIAEKTREFEKIDNSLSMPKLLKEKEKEIADLRAALKAEQQTNNYLDNACRELQGKLETVPATVLEVEKRLSEQEAPIVPPQKAEGTKPTQTIQRVTEREETKKERIIETVASDPFTNREIEWPLRGGQYVDIAKECKRSCQDIQICGLYPEINKGTVPQGANIRVRGG